MCIDKNGASTWFHVLRLPETKVFPLKMRGEIQNIPGMNKAHESGPETGSEQCTKS